MNHYTVKYINDLGEEDKVTVLGNSLNDALVLFEDSRWLFDAKELISIEPEKIP